MKKGGSIPKRTESPAFIYPRALTNGGMKPFLGDRKHETFNK